MRTPIQLRLSLTTLGVLLLGMGLAAGLTWLAVEKLYLDTQRENLIAQAQLTAAALQGTELPSISVEAYSQTANVQPGIHTRLLGEQGAVVVSLPLADDDTPVQVPLAENVASISPESLLQRPEIHSALNGIPDSAVRRVATAGDKRVLYASAPVYGLDGSVSGIVYLATPLPPARLPASLIWQLMGAIMIAILLAWFVGALLSRRIARPLERLASAAGEVARGDLEQQVPVDSNITELHSLGEAFNNMTADLRQSDQAKTAFIADVTHELRTPLTVINGTIETLEDGAIDDLEGRGPLLKSMAAETKRLIRLVNDLLILTRADAGALNLNFDQIDLGELACARSEQFSTLAESRRVTIDVDVREQAFVWGDADRLIQVLDNLLDNALRYAPDGSVLTVTVAREGNEVRCAISDQGMGIPAQHLSLIFERFYRVESSRDRTSGGSGLGLAIVHSLLKAQGGRIEAESLAGQGTTMTVWFPADENRHNPA